MNSAVTPVAWSFAEALERLQGDDLSERYYAAWYLGTLGDPAALPALLVALEDEADRTALGGYPLRRNAAKALGAIGDPAAVPGLVNALECTDYYVREEAAYALAQIGDGAAIPGIVALFRDPEAHQPWEALIRALGVLQARQYGELIRPFLDHASERVQAAAASVLYRFTGDPGYGERLLQGLTHENVSVRRAVLADVGETGYVAAAPAIVATDAAVSLKLNALKRLFDVAIQDKSAAADILRVAEALIPWIEALL
jgi:HEAT repeat protein